MEFQSHPGDLNWAPGFWLRSDPAPTDEGTEKMEQRPLAWKLMICIYTERLHTEVHPLSLAHIFTLAVSAFYTYECALHVAPARTIVCVSTA